MTTHRVEVTIPLSTPDARAAARLMRRIASMGRPGWWTKDRRAALGFLLTGGRARPARKGGKS